MFSNFFFSENRAVYEILWKYTVDPGGAQMAIWRMRIVCWITKATYAYSGYVIFIVFRCSSGCTNAP